MCVLSKDYTLIVLLGSLRFAAQGHSGVHVSNPTIKRRRPAADRTVVSLVPRAVSTQPLDCGYRNPTGPAEVGQGGAVGGRGIDGVGGGGGGRWVGGGRVDAWDHAQRHTATTG